MDVARWEQIKELYHAALERPEVERAAWLATACAGDEALQREAAALLAAHTAAPDFLAVPALEREAKAAAVTFARPAIAEQFSHYQILGPLGAGGMGEVYLARDTALDRRVAIKVLPARFTADAERLRRFTSEAKTASALNHPNIITIHEIGQLETAIGSVPYLVTEFIEGETLRACLQAGKLPLTQALDLVLQIAAALAAAHQAGIVHRDIKPENVMVRPDGLIKLLDFGLAKLTEPTVPVAPTAPERAAAMPHGDSSASGGVLGTPRYMSPEQARGESVDTRTDIFSLGVLLYEMLAGAPPFKGATVHEIIAAILRDEPLPLSAHLPGMPSALERIIGQTLRKERGARYQTAGGLLADLQVLKHELELPVKWGLAGQANPLVAARLPPDVLTAALHGLADRIQPRRASVPPGLNEKDLLLLADFENQTGDPVFDGTLKQGLAMQLRQSPCLGLFPEERVRHTLRLMRLSPDERVTVSIARALCVRHNLKAFIAGSIVPLGSHFIITLAAIHGQTGETMESEQVEAKGKEQVLRALSRAATRLRAKLGESLPSIQQFNTELEETTTQKLEAFQAYAQGYEQMLNGRIQDALRLYQRAVELDPDFAYAWSMLSMHHYHTGRPGLSAEYAAKAFALRGRLSAYEQPQITFRYHFNCTGDMNQALEAALLFKRMYPHTSTAPIDLVAIYDLLGCHEAAVAEGREAVRLSPTFGPAYWYLGRTLLRVSRFAEAKEVFRQALEYKFDVINVHAALYQIAFAEGDTAGLQQQLAWAQGRPDEFVALDWQAGAAACAGQWRQARECARRAIDLAAHGDAQELAARYATEQALRGAVLADYAQAKADAAHGLQLANGRASLPRAALALALCGETEQVRPLIDELSQRYPEDTVINSIWLPTIRAALALQSDNAAQALALLETTTSYEAAAEFWPQSLRGQAYLQLGRGAEAAAEFQKILAHRGHAPLSPLYPLAQLGLARAAALAGDMAQSRRAYEDFFAAWQAADADLPMLNEARREYER